jgi:hypothetical protein
MPMTIDTSYEVGDYIPQEQRGDTTNGVTYKSSGQSQDGYGPAPVAFNGSRSVMFLCGPGDPPWSGGTGTTYRSEHEHLDHEPSSSGMYCWYGFALYLNSDWKIGSEGWRIFAQWHLGSGSPGLKLMYENNTWYWRMRTTTSTDFTIQTIGTLATGQWHRFVVKARWRTGTDGLFKIWHNDTLVVDRSGIRTVATSSASVYSKRGLYHTSGADGYVFGDSWKTYKTTNGAEDAYSTVNPSGGSETGGILPPPSSALIDYSRLKSKFRKVLK